jgi:hypothetical protein
MLDLLTLRDGHTVARYARRAVSVSHRILLITALAPLVAGCSSATSPGAPTTTGPAPADAGTAVPFQVVVNDDTIEVSTTAITTTDGATLLAFSPTERSCIDATVATVADLAATLGSSPGTVDDPDTEQTLSEIVVGCVAFDRFENVVAVQLAAQPELAGVDRTCLDREISSLQDTPDVLASVLRGDPDALTVIAGTASTNCG